MSWLFGYKTNPPQSSSNADTAEDEAAAPPTLTKAEKKAMEAYRFDSSALERAARAAKELEKSSKRIFCFT